MNANWEVSLAYLNMVFNFEECLEMIRMVKCGNLWETVDNLPLKLSISH